MARSVPTTGILALVCLGLTTGIGGADASSKKVFAPIPRSGQFLLPSTGSLPGPDPRGIAAGLSGGSWRTGLSGFAVIAGSSTTVPAPFIALPSRSTFASLVARLGPISGGQSDVLPPAPQARFARATVFRTLSTQAVTESAHPDSPPVFSTARGQAASLLPGLTTAALVTTSPVPATVASAVFLTSLQVASRPASLRLERIVDSQNLSSNSPLPEVLHPGDPTRDSVASAQRQAAPIGLKLSGVHPQDTTYEQPPTATPTATATIVEPTATPTVPPTDSATATPVPPPPIATASPVPTVAVAALPEAAASSTAAAWSAPVETVIPVPPADTPAPATVVVPISTPMPQAAPVPGNAQWFQVTGYVATGSRTATGTWPTVGRTLAVDPSVIPLGATVYIQGLGVFIAEDTGGGVVGRHVDVFVSSVTDAYAITGERLVSWTTS